jgi:RNA polymerase-interacting CarD/CdnL/TRCF family regulator
MENNAAFLPGEWVVQRHHGPGLVKGSQVMKIGGQENVYYEVETRASTLWLPEQQMNDEWLRPLASPEELDEALTVLRSAPQPLESNSYKRRGHIMTVRAGDMPAEVAPLLRDLWARRKAKKSLSMDEENTLRHLTDCFLTEWSLLTGLQLEAAGREFEALLSAGRKKANLSVEA